MEYLQPFCALVARRNHEPIYPSAPFVNAETVGQFNADEIFTAAKLHG